MENSQLLESFALRCRLKNLTPASEKNYVERLSYLIRFAASKGRTLGQLTRMDLQEYVAGLIGKVSGETVNGRIRCYRVLFRHLHDEGLIDGNPMERISLVRPEKRVKPVLSIEDVRKILAGFNIRTFAGSRNRCLFLLLYDSMLRLDEGLSLKIADINLKDGLVKVTQGKGRKDRIVPASDQTIQAIHSYLIRYRKGAPPNDILLPGPTGEKLQRRRGHRIVSQAATKVGLKAHPHLLRHSGASAFIRAGGSVSILQRILGHSSLVVTQRYVTLNTADVSESFARFSPMTGVIIN